MAPRGMPSSRTEREQPTGRSPSLGRRGTAQVSATADALDAAEAQRE